MSLATSLGHRAQPLRRDPRARPQAHARPADPAQPRARDPAPRLPRPVRRAHARHHLAGGRGPRGMGDALERICHEAHEAIAEGVNIIILSDRALSPASAPIPSLLAVASVHHHLVREGTRLRAGIILESGEPREVHHFATLIGYGVERDQPLPDARDARRAGRARDASRVPPARSASGSRSRAEQAAQNIVKAIGKGLLKTISKMGISTIQSYRGAQIFEAVGLERELIDRHFTGTASRIGGVGLEVLAHEALERHARAYPASAAATSMTCCPSAASTPGGATASTTCGTPRRSRSSSTPCARPTATSPRRCGRRRRARRGARQPRLRQVPRVRGRVNEDAARKATLRGLLADRRERSASRSRWRRSSPRARSCGASAPAP